MRLLRPLRSTGSATTLTSSGSNAAGGPGSVGPADNPVQGLFQRLPLPEVSSARRPSPSFRARGSDLPSPSLAHARSRPGRVEHDRGLYYWIDVYEEGHWQRDLTTAAPRLPTMDGGLGSREPARASWVCLPARPGSRRQPSEASTTKVSLQSIPSPRRTYLQGIYRATTLTPRSERVFPFRSIQAARRARPAQRSSLPPSPPLRDGIRSNPPYTGRTGSCLRAAAVRHPSHAISDAIHRDDVATAPPLPPFPPVRSAIRRCVDREEAGDFLKGKVIIPD